ncbi:hypothetical protein C8R44DRAFT_648340, partial [Mycena epipterygia]
SSNGYTFMAIVIYYIGNDGKLEECLIDFCELISEHSGKNMAAAVWETVEKFGLIGRLSSSVIFVHLMLSKFRSLLSLWTMQLITILWLAHLSDAAGWKALHSHQLMLA